MSAGVRITGGTFPYLSRGSSACARLFLRPKARGALVLAAIMIAVATVPFAGGAAFGQQASSPAGGLRRIGRLPLPAYALRTFDTSGNPAYGLFPAFIDAAGGRLYGISAYQPPGGELIEWDISRDIPILTRRRGVGVNNLSHGSFPNNWGLDGLTRRAYLLESNSIKAIDLRPDTDDPMFRGLRTIGPTWEPVKMVPGFKAMGITFSPEDRRLYVVGTLPPDGLPQLTLGLTLVMAIDVDSAPGTTSNDPRDINSSLAWVSYLKECSYPMFNVNQGAFIFRASSGPALYIPCVRQAEHLSDLLGVSGSLVPDAADGGLPLPGQGLVRVDLVSKEDPARPPGEVDRQDAATFPSALFPVSGNFRKPSGAGDTKVEGLAAFDPATERVFMVAQSPGAPGVWVFDGKLGAWVGFINSADDFNGGVGVNRASGHVYVREGSNRKVRVIGGRATPPAFGDVFPVNVGGGVFYGGPYLADPFTNRLFLIANNFNPADGRQWGIEILADETPQAESFQTTDDDAQTQDVAQGPNTVAGFKGRATGFGSRALLIGGYRGFFDNVGQSKLVVGGQTAGPVTVPTLLPVDRDAHGAAVGRLTLRANIYGDDPPGIIDIAGEAQAFAPSDSATDQEWQTNLGALGAWPWPQARCDIQVPQDAKTGSGGSAQTACTPASLRAAATASLSGLAAGGQSVGATSFDSKVYRDPARGIVTEVISSARGIGLSSASGSVAIEQVAATATVAAGGRPGTARAVWKRSISGVTIKDAQGATTQSFEGCVTTVTRPGAGVAEQGDCNQIAEAINSALGVKVKVSLPLPDVTATAKGAFAQVRKTLAQHLQGFVINNENPGGDNTTWSSPALEITVYNDADLKSHLVMQLAGIDTDSTYKINCTTGLVSGKCPGSPTDDATASSSKESDSDDDRTDEYVEGYPGTLATGASAEPQGFIERVKSILKKVLGFPGAALAFLIRNPKEALLFAGMWMLLAGVPSAAWRRRMLTRVLT